MNIKESFRYQNYLGSMIDQVCMYLADKSNVVKITELHKRSAANPDAQDEEIDATLEHTIDADVSDIIEFLYTLAAERHLVSQRIAQAKSAAKLCLDAEVSSNRTLRQIANTLYKMSAIKPSKRTMQGRAHKFNVEGNQMPYTYDIIQQVEPVFDIADIKHQANAFARNADDTSSKIDRYMIETEVDVTPVFDVTERMEDAIASFIERKKNDEDYVRAAV